MIALLHTFLNTAKRIINTCIGISFLYICLWLSSTYAFSLFWFILGIPILYAFFWGSELLLVYLIYRFSALRRRILGKHFIEGYWIEILYDRGKMESMAILQIVFEKNLTYLIKGESYTLSGEYRGSFSTPTTNYHDEEFALRYAYSGKLTEAMIAGTGILEFEAIGNEKIANFFQGHLIDNFHVKGATFEGERISHAEQMVSLKAKKEFMSNYLIKKMLYEHTNTGI